MFHEVHKTNNHELLRNFLVQDDPKLLGDNGEVPIPAPKSSLYLTKKTSQASRKPRAHPLQDRQETHHASRGFLSKVGSIGLNLHLIAYCWLFIHLFMRNFYDHKFLEVMNIVNILFLLKTC